MSIPENSAAHIATPQTVLISGASFAGLSAAWWLTRLGFAVTLVEIAPGIRKGGTPVDIREDVIGVVRRMGLFDQIVRHSLPPRRMDFLNANGELLAQGSRSGDETEPDGGWEIERDLLLDLLWDGVKDRAEFIFGDGIESLVELKDEVAVTFASGTQRCFSFVLGCDGTHSAVRRLWFGQEREFSKFLQHYFSLTIVDTLLLPENTSQMFNVPGRALMLNAYNGKTDIGFCFFSEQEIAYDRRDRAIQKQMITESFSGEAWRVPELLAEMQRSDNFYFDKLCQIRMPEWSRGRVALVGDAGYCPSPTAGMGGSMAILGATALADALQAHPGDLQGAFAAYDRNLRPAVERIQAEAVDFGLKLFVPDTQEAINERTALLQTL